MLSKFLLQLKMIKAKKHFGQNFLKDKSVLDKITQAIPKYVKDIVEIGPGLGDLTQELLKKARVQAYEIDSELIPYLRKKFQKYILDDKLELVNLDASEFFREKMSSKEYFLVANLPYYIASSLVLSALEDENCLGLLVMLQKEVAQKFCATKLDRNYGALSVLSELICERKLISEVSQECFEPAPKVKSALILLEKHSNYSDICEIEDFKAFLKECFKAPRKRLANNLSNKALFEILRYLDIQDDVRPHQLSAKDYLKIFTQLKERK